MLINLLILAAAFGAIWIGSGITVRSVEKLSRLVKTSSFLISFLVLGFFTSIGEASVGLNAILASDPEIFVGNLIGASIVIFTLIIPILAIVGNKIRVNSEFDGKNMPLTLTVIGLPALLVIDGKFGMVDAITSITGYIGTSYLIGKSQGGWQNVKDSMLTKGQRLAKDIGKILLGILIIFGASKLVVSQTEYFSNFLGISPFLFSLLLVSIGTNLPELSLAVRSAFGRNNQVAFGDYIGSAAFNTMLAGCLTLIYGKTITLTNSYQISLFYLLVGLGAVYYFARTKKTISKLEGVVMLCWYASFVVMEILMH